MNRRGFLRFFGAMPAAAAATVVAPVTHADVASLADRVADAEAGAIFAQMDASSATHTAIARITEERARVDEAIRALSDAVAGAHVPARISAPPVTLVYEPPSPPRRLRSLDEPPDEHVGLVLGHPA